MTRPVKHGGTLNIDGPVYYGGSRDELNELLRQKDDEIDRLNGHIKALAECIEELKITWIVQQKE